jgi:hypothetical protein
MVTISGESKFIPIIITAIFVLFFSCMIIGAFGEFLFHFDFVPARGTVTGYISYQEKGGIWGLEMLCWRDTTLSECETFDPNGKTYAPGKYVMTYDCDRFVWAWERSSLCKVVNATKIGEIS